MFCSFLLATCSVLHTSHLQKLVPEFPWAVQSEESNKEQEAGVPILWMLAWWKQVCKKLVQAGQSCLEAL